MNENAMEEFEHIEMFIRHLSTKYIQGERPLDLGLEGKRQSQPLGM